MMASLIDAGGEEGARCVPPVFTEDFDRSFSCPCAGDETAVKVLAVVWTFISAVSKPWTHDWDGAVGFRVRAGASHVPVLETRLL
ncbi:hypothetical protein E2C01_011847 [Portunus trituberculatus]|uniref:Uncharacterized protein n=1 Tax=Portunus trituberculatus TaxID=210409 RepID=A0A5B7DC68_PORTR|nr:hypothetical protein [Portunus trituberculatus]